MRLTCLVIVALLAGCLGPSDSSTRTASIEVRDQNNHAPQASDETPPGQPAAEPDPAPSQNGSLETPQASPQPPQPMHWDGAVTLGIEASDPSRPCQGPLNSCDKRPFQTKGTFDLEVTLTWEMATNDLDLFLYRDSGATSEFVSSDGINGASTLGATRQVLRYADLPPGDYRLWVAARHAGIAEYELDAEFQ